MTRKKKTILYQTDGDILTSGEGERSREQQENKVLIVAIPRGQTHPPPPPPPRLRFPFRKMHKTHHHVLPSHHLVFRTSDASK